MEKHLHEGTPANDTTARTASLHHEVSQHMVGWRQLHHGTANGVNGLEKFPSPQDLLGELNKEAQIQKGKAHNGFEQQDLNETVYALNRDLKHLKPEDMKLVAQAAKEIAAEKSQGKHVDTARHLKDLETACHGSDKARLVWNAAMLELAREHSSSVDLLHHNRLEPQAGFVHDPFIRVVLSDNVA